MVSLFIIIISVVENLTSVYGQGYSFTQSVLDMHPR